MLCLRVEFGNCPACFGKALFCLQGICFNVSLTPRHLQPSWFSPGPLGAGWKQPSPLGHFSTEWALKTWEGCGSRRECGGDPTLAVQTVVTPPYSPPSASFCIILSQFPLNSLCFIGMTLNATIAKTNQIKDYIWNPFVAFVCVCPSLSILSPSCILLSPPVVAGGGLYWSLMFISLEQSCGSPFCSPALRWLIKCFL